MSFLKEKGPAAAAVLLVSAALAVTFRGTLSAPREEVVPVPAAASPSSAARSIAVKERNGTTRNLASPTGRILVVHFWATWCPPCVEEFPGLVAAYRKLRTRRDIELVTVSVDDAWKIVDPWLAKQGAKDLPTLLDPTKGAAKAFGTEKFPETWILGPDGSVLAHVAGPMDWTRPEVLRQLDELAAALPKKA